MQFDACDGELAVRVPFNAPDGVVFVAVDNEPPVRRQREKRQHVAARQRCDKRGLGIDALRIAQIRRRGGSRHLDAVIEPPDMVATVILIAEVGVVTRPFNVGLVFSMGISVVSVIVLSFNLTGRTSVNILCMSIAGCLSRALSRSPSISDFEVDLGL